jgi:hypothetical protein
VAELFEIQARAHKFIHHIIPRPDKEKFAPAKANFEKWTTLDSTVLQWIYSTISFDLLTTILKKDPPLWLLGTVWLTSSKITLSYFHLP